MATTDPRVLPAADLARQVRRGERSPVDVVEDYLDRIDDRNDDLTAYVTVTGESARERALDAERAVERGEAVGPLHGVPVALKDLFAFKAGVRNTFGSRVFADFVPETDALVVERLEDAGAIVLGKTNTPEFGRRATTENDLVGATGNPFDPDLTAGGSSGGSAAAVADGLAALGQGSDAAGSIRIPAACCGVVGLKPAPGRVPAAARPNAFVGHTPFIERGPITRTVEDAALVLSVLAGPSDRDPLSLPAPDRDYVAATRRPVDDLAVAYSPDLGIAPVEPVVREAVEDTAADLRNAGATVDPVGGVFEQDYETLHDALVTAFQGLYAEMTHRFERAFGVDLLGDHREELTPEVRTRIEDVVLALGGAVERQSPWLDWYPAGR